QAVLKDYSADVVLADTFFLAAGWLHEAGGPPWAQLAVSALSFASKDTAPYGMNLPPSSSMQGRLKNKALRATVKLGFRDVLSSINQGREQFNLEPTDKLLFDTVSPYLYLASTVPGFEYPRSDLPAQVHFIGPPISAASGPFTPPDWWGDLQTDQPVVHVTQGTVATNPQDLLRPAIEALADEPLLVVATTGDEPVANLGPLPGNVRAAEFIPYQHLLPKVDVMVTNGGYGGVQQSLAQGIPLVAAGASEDKPEICARIAWCGAGIDLKTGSPQPPQIRDAVNKILTDGQYRQSAQRLQAEIQAYQPSQQAVALLEALATSQAPVLEAPL
ncbi:MAG: nucleotide disphospho-sugar-binding domain-containing protein, partial [Cyanobacteria bacterium P01_A01_bin.135]